MSTPIKHSNTKITIVISIIFGVITLVGLTLAAVLFLGAPSTTSGDQSNTGETLEKSLVPPVTDFAVTQDTTSEASFTFTLPEVPEGYYVEYKIEDTGLRQLYSGTAREPGSIEGVFNIKSGTDTVTLMMRVTDVKNYSKWVAVSSETVETATAEKDLRKVNDAFYTTPWALKTDTSLEALNQAFSVAFNVPVGTESLPETCYWGNSDTLSAGEIVRPRPDFGDDTYDLYIITTKLNDNVYNVDFYWCEK